MKRHFGRQGGPTFAGSFSTVSREEHHQAELFFADLMGGPLRRARPQPRSAEDGESWAETRPLIEGPLTDSEWRTVISILRHGEAQVGAPLTDNAERNALLVAARIFCDRNALGLEREDPLLCLINDVTMGDRRVRALVPHVTRRGPIIHWAGLMRSVGLVVNESAGWRARSSQGENGRFEPVGVMMHHTVGVGAGALADIVANVKANFFVDRAGVITVVAGGRANHAGTGAQRVLDEVRRGLAPTGTAARRGLTDGPIGNADFYGFENENRGDGVQPWPDVQVESMVRGAAALCRRHGWTGSRVISHAEWTSRKIDPRGIDMNAFRGRVAALL